MTFAQQIAVAAGAPVQLVEVGSNGVNLLMTLPNSRTNENEADLIGLELAARRLQPECCTDLVGQDEQGF